MSSDDHEVDLEGMGEAVTREQKGQLVYDTGDALAKIDVSGWTGRAADEFREVAVGAGRSSTTPSPAPLVAAQSRVAGIRESCRGLVEAADAVSRQA